MSNVNTLLKRSDYTGLDYDYSLLENHYKHEFLTFNFITVNKNVLGQKSKTLNLFRKEQVVVQVKI